MGRKTVVGAVVLIVLGLAPIFCAFLAAAIAGLNGCTLNEGHANPCIIAGSDWGNALSSMFIMAWLGVASLPLAGLGAFLLVVAGIARLLRRLRQR